MEAKQRSGVLAAQGAVAALAALAHESRLAVFRLLVETGPEGLAAGRIGSTLGLAPSSLSFHLKELSHAGLVRSRQQGRFVIYTADFPAMHALVAYLTDNCCGGEPCGSFADAGGPGPARSVDWEERR